MILSFISRFRTASAKSKRRPLPNRRRRLLAEQLEDRKLLTATLAYFSATGELRYVPSAVNNAAVVSFASGVYTITDSAEAITTAGFTDADSGTAGIQLNTTANPVSYIKINSSAGSDTYTIDSMESGDGLQILDSDTVGIDTITINAAIVGNSAVPSIALTSEKLNLNGSLQTISTIAFSGPNAATPIAVSLTGNSVLTSAGSLTVSGTIDGTGGGGQTLSATIGSANLKGNIGGSIAVGTLNLGVVAPPTSQIILGTTASPITINSSGSVGLTATTLIDVTGNVTGAGGVSVSAATIKLSNSSAVNFSATDAAISLLGNLSSTTTASLGMNAGNATAAIAGTVTGVKDVTIIGTQGVSISGSTTLSVQKLTVTAGTGALGFSAPSLTTTVGDIKVTGDTKFANGGAGTATITSPTAIQFLGAIDGNARVLDFQKGTSLQVTGAVTNATTFDADNGQATIFATVALAGVSAGNIRVESSANTLSDNLVASTDDVVIVGNVTLAGNVTLQSGLGSGDNVQITGSVNGDGVFARDFVMSAGAGTAELLGGNAIGNSVAVHSARVSGNAVNVNAITVTSGDLIFEGGVVKATGALTGTGNAIFRPRVAGGLLEIYNTAPSPASANMTVDSTTVDNLQSGFATLQFGDSATTKVTLFGDSDQFTSIDLSGIAGEIQFIGNTVEIRERIQQLTNPVTILANTAINFEENGLLLGTGTLTLKKLTAGAGNLTVGGARAIASQPAFPWGTFDLVVDGNGGDVTFLNQIARIASLHVLSTTNLVTFSHASAVESNNGINIESNASVRAGMIANSGDIHISGNTTLTGASNFFVTVGNDVKFDGAINGGGFATIIREKNNNAAGVGDVSIGGAVTNVSSITITKTADTLSVHDITSSGQVLIGGEAVTLNGTLTANNGLLYVQGGPVTLTGNTSLVNNSGTTSLYTRIDGTVNGAYSLTVDAGSGQAVFANVIGGTAALSSINFHSSGLASISFAMTVTGTFYWKTGDLNNAGADVLRILAAVNAGTSITLEGDSVTGSQALLTAPLKSVIQNGSP